jgi:hypothetical protein
LVAFFADAVDGFATCRFGDLVHGYVVSDLLTAEPPVVFIRVVQPVVEAPVRPGFALSHIPMLTVTCNTVADQALSGGAAL